MIPTFYDRGAKLKWMNAYKQWVISSVVSRFTHGNDEFAVVHYENGLANFRIISLTTGETRS